MNIKSLICLCAVLSSAPKLNAEVLRWVELRVSFTPKELEAIQNFLRRKHISLSTLLSIERENGETYYVCTSQGTFYSDDLQNWKVLPRIVGRTPGNNETGHKLPASSTGGHW